MFLGLLGYKNFKLCTKIEHSSLIEVLNNLVDFAFKGGGGESIRIEGKYAFWSSSKSNIFNKKILN